MNYDKLWRCLPGALVITLFTILIFPSCRGELPAVPAKEAFTKAKLEKLGSLLQPGILENYQLLPQLPPYDTSVYWYVQTLYNQATNTMHRDRQSAPDNRWDKNRVWRVFIINDDNLKHAFTLPGGDFFISTGMLRSFKKEYELYYLLTFEANLMHEGQLLNRLILEYNSLTLNNIIEENEGANAITAQLIAEELPQLNYDENDVKKNDQQTVRSVCETSVLDPTGIGPFLLTPETEATQWLKTRPSYDGRAGLLASMKEGGCGVQKGNGNYERFVLNILD